MDVLLAVALGAGGEAKQRKQGECKPLDGAQHNV
jgi:hypothetical protein